MKIVYSLNRRFLYSLGALCVLVLMFIFLFFHFPTAQPDEFHSNTKARVMTTPYEIDCFAYGGIGSYWAPIGIDVQVRCLDLRYSGKPVQLLFELVHEDSNLVLDSQYRSIIFPPDKVEFESALGDVFLPTIWLNGLRAQAEAREELRFYVRITASSEKPVINMTDASIRVSRRSSVRNYK